MRPCLECGQELEQGPKVDRSLMAHPDITLHGLDCWCCPGCGDVEVEIPRITDLLATVDANPDQHQWIFANGAWIPYGPFSRWVEAVNTYAADPSLCNQDRAAAAWQDVVRARGQKETP